MGKEKIAPQMASSNEYEWGDTVGGLGRKRVRHTWHQNLGVGGRWCVSGVGPSVRRRSCLRK